MAICVNRFVNDPMFIRKNTNDNTPAILHIDIVPGDKIHITIAPKGFGSENMSAVKMLTPSAGVGWGEKVCYRYRNGCRGQILARLSVVGVGIGGTFEKAAYLAKKALLRPINKRNADSPVCAT